MLFTSESLKMTPESLKTSSDLFLGPLFAAVLKASTWYPSDQSSSSVISDESASESAGLTGAQRDPPFVALFWLALKSIFALRILLCCSTGTLAKRVTTRWTTLLGVSSLAPIFYIQPDPDQANQDIEEVLYHNAVVCVGFWAIAFVIMLFQLSYVPTFDKGNIVLMFLCKLSILRWMVVDGIGGLMLWDEIAQKSEKHWPDHDTIKFVSIIFPWLFLPLVVAVMYQSCCYCGRHTGGTRFFWFASAITGGCLLSSSLQQALVVYLPAPTTLAEQIEWDVTFFQSMVAQYFLFGVLAYIGFLWQASRKAPTQRSVDRRPMMEEELLPVAGYGAPVTSV